MAKSASRARKSYPSGARRSKPRGRELPPAVVEVTTLADFDSKLDKTGRRNLKERLEEYVSAVQVDAETGDPIEQPVVMAVDLASFECAVAASPLEEGGKPTRLLFRSIVADPRDRDRCTTELKNKGALYDGLVFSHDVLRYRHLIESPRAPIKATGSVEDKYQFEVLKDLIWFGLDQCLSAMERSSELTRDEIIGRGLVVGIGVPDSIGFDYRDRLTDLPFLFFGEDNVRGTESIGEACSVAEYAGIREQALFIDIGHETVDIVARRGGQEESSDIREIPENADTIYGRGGRYLSLKFKEILLSRLKQANYNPVEVLGKFFAEEDREDERTTILKERYMRFLSDEPPEDYDQLPWRWLEIDYGPRREKSARIALKGEDDQVLRDWLDGIIARTEHLLRRLENEFGEDIYKLLQRIVLTGGGAQVKGLDSALALAVEDHFGLNKTPRVDVVRDHHLAAASGLLMETIFRWLHTPDQLKASPTGTLS